MIKSRPNEIKSVLFIYILYISPHTLHPQTFDSKLKRIIKDFEIYYFGFDSEVKSEE